MASSIDLKQLKKLINLLEESSSNEREGPESQGNPIRLSKGSGQVMMQTSTPLAAPAPAQTPVEPEVVAKSDDKEIGTPLCAPMIGTVYHTPSPDAPPFVKVGDTIEVGQTLCLIEAMKMFNKIKAEKKGVIKKILVEHVQAIEYDQPLFLIEDQ